MNRSLHPARVQAILTSARGWLACAEEEDKYADRTKHQEMFAHPTVPATFRLYARSSRNMATKLLRELDVNLSG